MTFSQHILNSTGVFLQGIELFGAEKSLWNKKFVNDKLSNSWFTNSKANVWHSPRSNQAIAENKSQGAEKLIKTSLDQFQIFIGILTQNFMYPRFLNTRYWAVFNLKIILKQKSLVYLILN